MQSTSIHLQSGPLVQYRKIAGLTGDAELARAMGMHRTTVTRTLTGQAQLTAQFIEGMLTAFPALGFGDLFEVVRHDDADGEDPELVGAA